MNILVAGQVGAAKKGPAAIVRMEENSPLATKWYTSTKDRKAIIPTSTTRDDYLYIYI